MNLIKIMSAIGLTVLLSLTPITHTENIIEAKPPYIKISPTNVSGIVTLWFTDCESKPPGTEVMILMYDCDGNPVGSKFWTPCEGTTANDATVAGTGNPGIVKYIMTVPSPDGSRRVVESDRVSL